MCEEKTLAQKPVLHGACAATYEQSERTPPSPCFDSGMRHCLAVITTFLEELHIEIISTDFYSLIYASLTWAQSRW